MKIIVALALAALTTVSEARPICNWVHDMALLVEAQKQNGQSKHLTLKFAQETFGVGPEFTYIQYLADQAYKLPIAPVNQRSQWIKLFASEQYHSCMQ
jgi:hypothetical protein